MSLGSVRGALALLLALTLTMPAYTCSGYRAPDGALVRSVPAGADAAQYVRAPVPYRPLEGQSPRASATWLAVFAYTWPLLLLVAEWWRPRFARHWTATLLGIVLPIASGFWIWITILGDIAYGAIVSFIALGAMLGVQLRELWVRRRERPLPAIGA